MNFIYPTYSTSLNMNIYLDLVVHCGLKMDEIVILGEFVHSSS